MSAQPSAVSHQPSALRGVRAPLAALRGPAAGAVSVAALVALAACHSVSDLEDPAFRVTTDTVWAGGTILLTSEGLVGADTLPLVLVGADTAATVYAAPDTLRVAAPDSAGVFTVWVGVRGGTPIAVGEVSVEGGYVGSHVVSEVGGYPLQWPGGDLPSFLIAGPSGLARVDPRSWLRSTLLPDSIFSQLCINGPGPAPGGRVAVIGRLPAGCGPLVALRPDAPWIAPDTGPSGGEGGRFAAQLGPSHWLVAYQHGVLSYYRVAGGPWQLQGDYTDDMEEPQGIAVSPRGDRAAVLCRADGTRGIPVFTPESAEPAYWLTRFRDLWAAQFSDDSDTLFVVADTGASAAPMIAALRASDGTVLRSGPAWPGTHNLVLDPGRPWLYLVGYSSGKPVVQVLDRASFAIVATLQGAAATAGMLPGFYYPMLAAADRRLYLIDSCTFCNAGGGTFVFAFDLMH
jgi:hypothetical protein